MRKVTIKVGDRVAYRVAFLRNIGMAHSSMASAKGTVTALMPFGDSKLASITWENAGKDELPAQVLDQNLARVGTLAYTSEDA